MIGSFAQLVLTLVAPSILSSCSVNAQTFTNCNPLSQSCPPDPALGKSVSIDFTKGASDLFTTQGSPSFGSNGAQFTVAKSGDSPQIISKFYIMFGKFELTIKAAPGAGIVSSAVLQSDDLDEIDWEWLGADDGQVQSNYFGKGQTGSYNRGAFHPAPGNQDGFHTYTIDWSANQIAWEIDGTTVRTLLPAASNNQYPQTPMQIKIGAWSGGDPANAPGTIQWAHGPTNYANGPYSMFVKSITVTDYSTGTQYKYGDNSGSWQSIVAVGGSVNSDSDSPSQPPPASSSSASAPGVTSSAPPAPLPFGSSSSSPGSNPSIYPWVPSSQTTMTTSTVSMPGLPSDWSVSNSGKIFPPSSAAVSQTALSASSPSGSAGSSDKNKNSTTSPAHPPVANSGSSLHVVSFQAAVILVAMLCGGTWLL